MQNMKTILGAFFVLTLFIVSRAEATTVQYMLDQSNRLEDDIDYLLITVSDNKPGQLDFLVETRSALDNIAGRNFGIDSFAFNLGSATGLSRDDFKLPVRWKSRFDRRMSEAGRFDVLVKGTGRSRQGPLQFSVMGLELEDVISGFAAHVAGFTIERRERRGRRIPSAFFYGDRLTSEAPSEVPVPAAFWLFGSGMLLLGRLATRRRR